MCGRIHIPGERQFLRTFQDTLKDLDRQFDYDLEERWNTAPTNTVPVLRSIDGRHVASQMRWGLIPAWAKGVAPKYSTINARIEGIKTAASYRAAWKRAQRCIVLAEGFYEWHRNDD